MMAVVDDLELVLDARVRRQLEGVIPEVRVPSMRWKDCEEARP
jgi:hypothetical protein